ncbi:MAG: HupE/UreJ family protein [Pseudomonadota bacterium]
MVSVLIDVLSKLRFALALSTLCGCLWAGLWAGTGAAHETDPTVADISAEGGTLRLQLRLNLDAFLAGIDLTKFTDTDMAPQAAAYDALRALPPDQVAGQAGTLVPGWNALPLVAVDGTPLALSLVSADVLPEPDIERARSGEVILSAALPRGARYVEVMWPQDGGAFILRQQGVEAPFTGYVPPGTSSGPIPLAGAGASAGWQAFGDYITIGFAHIVPLGLDHILFVLGLFFLSLRASALLWQVAAFTLAHTITLALVSFGLLNVPPGIVAPLIAASIVFVAVENLLARGLTPWRPLVVFGFGLLHGLDFADGLSGFGLPDAAVLPALIGFNVGVEIGQLSVIAAAVLLVWLAAQAARRAGLRTRAGDLGDLAVMHRAVSFPGSLVIAGIGLWWLMAWALTA